MKRRAMDGPPIAALAALRQWVQEHLGDTRHERRVVALAGRLVRVTVGLHSLDRFDLRLLRWAAMVHDVGRCHSARRHPEIGARMILKELDLPLRNRHRRELAWLTLNHRGRAGDARKLKPLRRSDDVQRLRLLLAFLRAADALDSRSIDSPSVRLQLRRNVLLICCRDGTGELEQSSFARPKKFRLLQRLLGCRVQVVIEPVRRLRMVA